MTTRIRRLRTVGRWKLAPNGDSGIYLRGCPQVQLGTPRTSSAPNGADKGSGALWNNQTHERWPTEVADKPVGQWNKMYVRMVGEYVTVVLNGKTVVDNVVLENYFDREVPVFARGPIHLQTHGSEMRFRNLFVREIPPEEANELLGKIRRRRRGVRATLQRHGLRRLDRRHRQLRSRRRRHPLQGGARRQPAHDREYGNFVVRLEFQLPPAATTAWPSARPPPTSTPPTRASNCRCSTTTTPSRPTSTTTNPTAASTAWRRRTAATCGRRASGTTRKSSSTATASKSSSTA